MSAFTRLRLIGSSSIIAGLLLLGAGIWCITTLNGPSFAVDTFAGAHPTAHDFVLLILEIALTLGGAYSLVFGFVTMRKSRKQLTFSRAMHFVDVDFVADPKMSTPGRCWQCGRKVRPGNTICYACGAAQHRGRRMRTGVLPPDGALPTPMAPMAPIVPTYPQPPMYQPGAQVSWDLPDEPMTGDEAGPRTHYPWQ